MKKWLALLLAVVLLLTLSACGKKDKNVGDLSTDELKGTWTMSLNLNALLNSGAMQTMSSLFQMMNVQDLGLKLATDVTFTDNAMEVNPDGLVNFYRDLFNAMENWLTVPENAATFEKYCQDNGQDANLLKQQITNDALVTELAEELVSEMGEMCYALDGDKLYTWNATSEKDPYGFYQFTYADGVITVTMVAEDGNTIPLSAGDFTFTKK